MKAGIIVFPGTNMEYDVQIALQGAGFDAELVHYKQFLDKPEILKEEKREIWDYDLFVLPGGFSYADYIAAGRIASSILKYEKGFREDLKEFISQKKPVLGICNGYQILADMGIVPATGKVAFLQNLSTHYECRWVNVKMERKCAFTSKVPDGSILRIPVAHAFGNFYCDDSTLKTLEDDGLVVLRYVDGNGKPDPTYPINPNGSINNIAGIMNPEGNVLGTYNHIERATWKYQYPDWTKTPSDVEKDGDGMLIWESVKEYIND